MEQIPWFAWIPLAGIGGWVLTAFFEAVSASRRSTLEAKLAEPQRALFAESTAASWAQVERLDRIDLRLAAIEKTLTDIP